MQTQAGSIATGSASYFFYNCYKMLGNEEKDDL